VRRSSRANELLLSLRAWWPRLSNQLTQAGARALGEVPIAGRRLDRLYLRRGALARADQGLELPFVPVDDPEDRRWDFLEQLGVAIRLNAQFFLNKLVHMQGAGREGHRRWLRRSISSLTRDLMRTRS
jgi:hypothetical protein